MQRVRYAGWENCYRIANGAAELIVTGDVGPRVLRFAPRGGENVFAEFPEMLGKTGGDEWRIYGGHRLWHSPEARPRSYFPDNSPVFVEPLGDGLRVTQPIESTTGIQKEIDLELLGDQAAVRVTHRLRNANLWPITLAPWALSVMARGGTAVAPLPEPGEHEENLGPVGCLALWAYTDLSDARLTLGRRYLLVRQDPQAAGPIKIGLGSEQNWAGYVRAGVLFVKQFAACSCGQYPDFGCSVEVYTDRQMLELETLGPLTPLTPGSVTEHVEHWMLFDNVPTPGNDADVQRDVLARLS